MTREESEKYIKSKMCNDCSVYLGGGKCSDNCKVIEAIKALEQEPKTGYWIVHHESITLLTGGTATGGVICSECGYKTHNKAHILVGCPYKYCPNCGARMVEP